MHPVEQFLQLIIEKMRRVIPELVEDMRKKFRVIHHSVMSLVHLEAGVRARENQWQQHITQTKTALESALWNYHDLISEPLEKGILPAEAQLPTSIEEE